MSYTYVLYVDVLVSLFAANFLFDYLLLWATGAVTGRAPSRLRLAGGALLGTLYFFAVYLSGAGILPGYGILKFPVTTFLVAALMVWLGFRPKGWRQFLSLSGFFAGIGLIAGGAGLAASYILGNGTEPNVIWGTVIALAAILIVAEMGWGVVHRKIWQHLYYVPLEVFIGGQGVTINALIDTGNSLQDPLTGRPVIVVEIGELEDILPKDLVASLRDFGGQEFGGIDMLGTGLGSRFCLVPFATIGTKSGLMPGFRPDYVRITAGGETVRIDRVIVGVCLEPLDRAGNFQALIPPDILGNKGSRRAPDTTISQRGESLNA